MARLTESQLAGFRTGTNPSTAEPARPQHRGRNEPPPEAPTRQDRTEQPALKLTLDTTNTPSPLGPVPRAPTRGEPRHKIGITLPLELAEQVRALTQQGYALADLVIVAYRAHRDELVSRRQTRRARQLEGRRIGRSSFTVTLSAAERDGLDSLAQHLDATRSQTVAALLERQLLVTEPADTSPTTPAPPLAPRSHS